MKKFISIILTIILVFSLFSIVSCGNKDDDTTVRIATLNGTTGFGLAYLMEQNANDNSTNKYEFTIESDASVVQSLIISGDVDMAALPTNAASALFNKTKDIEIIAINTLGVLYLIENGNSIQNMSDLDGKTIYCPAQNPTFILKYLLEKYEIDATIDSTTYAAPADLRTAVATNLVDIAVLPEPMVTIATKANSNLRVAIDLTEAWDEVEQEGSLVQGCIVARKDFIENHPEIVEKFLDEYKVSIEYLNQNVSDSASLVAKYKIFENENVAKLAIPKCNVAFIEGDEMKTAMEKFLQAMYSVNPKSIGEKLPTDDFYYKR